MARDLQALSTRFNDEADVRPFIAQHANAIYIGDFYRNFGYPFADQANGGSIRGMITAIDMIAKTAGPDATLRRTAQSDFLGGEPNGSICGFLLT